MKLLRIDERLPESPLHAEVVLHVRRHLRASIRSGAPSAPADLAHLFGFARKEGTRHEWIAAAGDPAPIQQGALVAARRRGGDGVVLLGHERAHVLECKRWLLQRKQQDDAFKHIKASDLATLLELSKARDLAVSRAIDEQGHERFLPILIQGPTGTGKELLAEAIHHIWAQATNRPSARLHVVQIAGLPADIINDELFGHVRGAFTGASKDGRTGRLEAADQSTLLIDEVGDLPKEAQLGLLRFLQTQTMSRLGENTERVLSVRVLAATWHDLDADVAAGRFREDLLHRLRVGAGLVLPPLARREGFFDEVLPELLRARRHTATPPFTRSARDALAAHTWPGNLRELVGVLDAALACSAGETLRVEHLPPLIQRHYLGRPLYERALGFLLDETDGQSLSSEHIAWRIAELDRSFEQAPPPPPNEQLHTTGQFLSLLDDSSDEHRRCVADIRRLLELDQARQRAAVIEEFWHRVPAVGIPSWIKEQTEKAAQAAREARAAREHEIEQVQANARIGSNPWLRLFEEIHGLPLLRSANRGDLGRSFLAVFNLVKLLAPSLIEQIRDDAQVGGFPKVRERLASLLRDSHDHEDSSPEDLALEEGTSLPPGRLSRKDWQDLTRRFPTQRAAVETTGYDPKTIAKYLALHDIDNPWRTKAKEPISPTGPSRRPAARRSRRG